MISVLVDKMIRTQIVDCAAVANWIFSSDMAHDFTRYTFMTLTFLIFVLFHEFFTLLTFGMCQILHVGDSSLHYPKNEQTCPEDPERAGGSERQAGKTAAQEGMVEFVKKINK